MPGDREPGGGGIAVADVADLDALRAAADAAVSRFGRFDSWLHYSGVAIYGLLLKTPAGDHERLFQTNYWRVVNGAQVGMPVLRKIGGAVVVVGSVVSDIGTPVLGAYAASKHAAKGFVDCFRIEMLAERAPVSITLVKPSGIAAPLAKHAAHYIACAGRIPPPAYAPELVARAAVAAAQGPRR